MGRHVVRMGEKPQEKRPLGRPRLGWMEWNAMDWIDVAQHRDQ
jgi:hypothetical protein